MWWVSSLIKSAFVSAVSIALGAYFSTICQKAIAISRLAADCKRSRKLVLTYDDGPGAGLTPYLLDLLESYGAKGTFFLLGRRIPGNTSIVDRLVLEGHEVGCHTQNHLHAWKTWPWKAVRDINAGYETISKWVGPDALFRPPYGKMNLLTWLAVWNRGAPIGYWTVDSGDTWKTPPSSQSIVDKIFRDGGGVVLMHDFDRGPERARHVLKTTELLLDAAKREGFKVCRFGDLLASESKRCRKK